MDTSHTIERAAQVLRNVGQAALADQLIAEATQIRRGLSQATLDILASQSEHLPSDIQSILSKQTRIHGRTQVYTAYNEMLNHRLRQVRILAEIVKVKSERADKVLRELYESHYEMAVEICPFILGQNFILEIEGERHIAVLAGIVFRPVRPYFRLLLRMTKERLKTEFKTPDSIQGYSDLFFWDNVNELVGVQNASDISDKTKQRVELLWKEGVVVTRPPWLDKKVHPLVNSERLQVYRYNALVKKLLSDSKTPDMLPVADLDVMDLLVGGPEIHYVNPARLDPSRKHKRRHLRRLKYGSLVKLVNSDRARNALNGRLRYTVSSSGKYVEPEEVESVVKPFRARKPKTITPKE